MRTNHNTTLVAVRVPERIMAEIKARIIPWERGQTEVILDALCEAFSIPKHKPKKDPTDESRTAKEDRGAGASLHRGREGG